MFTHISILHKIFELHPFICTDTRDIKKDAIFFALKGANFNGNTFAAQALKSGCSYVVVDEEQYKTGDRFLLVPNALEALQSLANYHRRMLNTPIIAITGSNGKTTSKELIAAVLSRKFNTLYTKGNLNNHIGVPLTLLSLTKEHEIAVVEMGANHQGEIADLCAIAEPNFGMITNIGKAHLEGFGGVEGVIKGKTEMYKYINKSGGLLFVCKDNELLVKYVNDTESLYYGTTASADVVGQHIDEGAFVSVKWKLHDDAKSISERETIKTKLVGKYNYENVLAACCIGNHFGVNDKQIKDAIESYIPDNSRSQVIEKGSNRIILDAYNANPTSMRAAIENFASIDWKNKMLVLGDMLELGDESAAEHQGIVDLLKQKGFINVVLIGKYFKATNNSVNAQFFEKTEEALIWFKKNLPQNASILIKGSRGVKLERVVDVV